MDARLLPPIEERKAAPRSCCPRRTPVLRSIDASTLKAQSSFTMPANSAATASCRNGSAQNTAAGDSMDWIKVKNPAAPAVRREAEKIGGGECEDHVGTYVIPLLCQWSEGT